MDSITVRELKSQADTLLAEKEKPSDSQWSKHGQTIAKIIKEGRRKFEVLSFSGNALTAKTRSSYFMIEPSGQKHFYRTR